MSVKWTRGKLMQTIKQIIRTSQRKCWPKWIEQQSRTWKWHLRRLQRHRIWRTEFVEQSDLRQSLYYSQRALYELLKTRPGPFCLAITIWHDMYFTTADKEANNSGKAGDILHYCRQAMAWGWYLHHPTIRVLVLWKHSSVRHDANDVHILLHAVKFSLLGDKKIVGNAPGRLES